MLIIQTISSHFSTNTYVVRKDGVSVVIDPSGDASDIFRHATKDNCQLTAILLTHGHFDHIDALQELIALSGTQTYVARADFPMLANPYLNASGLVLETISVSVDNVTLLDGGEELCFGSMRFKVLHTPGHTVGSLCYVAEDALFSGDTLFADGYGRTDLPNSAPSLYVSSILLVKKLLKSHTLYPGHGRILIKE